MDSGPDGASVNSIARRFSPFCPAANPIRRTREKAGVSAPAAPLHGDAMLAAVTVEMVALHERYHHRKPVTAKTQLLGDDLLVCVLGGVYTDVEKTMIELQKQTVVQETRSELQTAMQHKFIKAVARLSGRNVLAFISNSHVGPDLEMEIFMLAPPDDEAEPQPGS